MAREIFAVDDNAAATTETPLIPEEKVEPAAPAKAPKTAKK